MCGKLNEDGLREVRTGGRVIHEGKILTFIEDEVLLPDGNKATREVVRHPGGVCVAPLTSENELLFVRQWRYPYNEVTLELPAGKLAKGEDVFEAAARELKEETGASGTLRKLGEMYPSPGYTDEIIRLFIATDLSYGDASPDDDEFLLTERIPLEQAVDMVLRGELKDAKTCQLVLMIDKSGVKNEE